jgi:tRNA pseudouridine55 synthase
MEPKEYFGTIHFGIETTTQDAEGEVIRQVEVPEDLEEKIATVLPSFIGEIKQVPPMYSAIKKQGKPLYAYARAGTEVERETRTVYVHEIEMIAVDRDLLTFRVSCSGGTYVRTIANDLGHAVGCGAHLAALRRTLVGRFDVAHAKCPDQLKACDLLTLAEALAPMPICSLPAQTVAQVRDGQAVHLDKAYDSRHVALADEHGLVFSVAAVAGPMAKPLCVIPKEAMVAEI